VFTYVAYGLGIHCVLELPELTPGPAPPDVVVRQGRIPERPRGPTVSDSALHASGDEACLYWPDIGAFLLRQGREITFDPRPDMPAGLIRLYLLGPVLGLLLHQRGLFVLHASAVALDGGVVAFLGHSGRGKSTTAAVLYARGGAVVADDAMAVDLAADGGPAALPGFPQLKLLPDAVTALGENPEDLPRIHAGDEKRARAVSAVATAPGPLRRLYVLTDADALGVEPLHGHAAVFEVLQHSFVAPALEQLGSSRFLAECTRLAAAVPVRRLRRPRNLARLDELAALIEADAAGPPTNGPSGVARRAQ
jgi:hypothetical protein